MSLISNSFCPEATGQTEVNFHTEIHETRGLELIETGEVI